MGKAGVNFVGLIEYSGEQDRESFNMVSHSLSLFPAPERTRDNQSQCSAQTREVLVQLDPGGDFKGALGIDGACIGDLIDDLETAQYILGVQIRSGRYSEDDEIQLGLASAVHFVYLLGEKVGTALNRSLDLDEELRIPGLVPVPSPGHTGNATISPHRAYPWTASCRGFRRGDGRAGSLNP